jgi:peroxiredoxin
MIRPLSIAAAFFFAASMTFAGESQPAVKGDAKVAPQTVGVGTQAPAFKIKDTNGNEIDLAELTAKGPVLVRLTCGCAGCDKEIAYFQAINESYKDLGLTSLAIFRMPDGKVADYAKSKQLNMLYAVDPKGEAWNVFETKTMPTNFLIAKGGKIISVAAGCDPSGLIAEKLSEKVAKAVKADVVDVQRKVAAAKADKK